jgi:hypothetical protein
LMSFLLCRLIYFEEKADGKIFSEKIAVPWKAVRVKCATHKTTQHTHTHTTTTTTTFKL